jgi:ribosome-binding factor A
MSIRTERVASLIREEIGSYCTREYNNPAYGFITVTEVRVTPDLRLAKVYFSIFGKPEVQELTMAMLQDERKAIRGYLGSRLSMRFTPDLEFLHDTTMERVDRLNRIFKEIHDANGGSDGSTGT